MCGDLAIRLFSGRVDFREFIARPLGIRLSTNSLDSSHRCRAKPTKFSVWPASHVESKALSRGAPDETHRKQANARMPGREEEPVELFHNCAIART